MTHHLLTALLVPPFLATAAATAYVLAAYELLRWARAMIRR